MSYALHLLQADHIRAAGVGPGAWAAPDTALKDQLAGAAIVVVNASLDPTLVALACPEAVALPSFNSHMMFAGGANAPYWQAYRANFDDDDFYSGRMLGPDGYQNPEFFLRLKTAEKLAQVVAERAAAWNMRAYMDDCWTEMPRRYLSHFASFYGDGGEGVLASAWRAYRSHLVRCLDLHGIAALGNIGQVREPDPYLSGFAVEGNFDDLAIVDMALDHMEAGDGPLVHTTAIAWKNDVNVEGLVMPGRFLAAPVPPGP